jgi:hypothetical protein
MLSLALVSALIVVNKVGSPQFISWLAVPIVLGLLTSGRDGAPSFRVPAALTLVIAALTHTVYPYLYYLLLASHPAMVTVLSIRNIALIVLLVWAVVCLVRLASRAATRPSLAVNNPKPDTSSSDSPRAKEST